MFGGASWALHRRQEAAQHHSCDAGATAMCSRWETGHRGEFHSGLLVGPLPLCLLTTKQNDNSNSNNNERVQQAQQIHNIIAVTGIAGHGCS